MPKIINHGNYQRNKRNIFERKFNETYSFFADDICWNIIGDKKITGKQNVIDYCNKMEIEIGVTVLNNLLIIEDKNSVAITGFCEYVNEKKLAGKVEYCDVYRFEEMQLKEITSYCIDLKI